MGMFSAADGRTTIEFMLVVWAGIISPSRLKRPRGEAAYRSEIVEFRR
jgi:hypothetical protein